MVVSRSAPWGRVTKPAVARVSERIALQGNRCLCWAPGYVEQLYECYCDVTAGLNCQTFY